MDCDEALVILAAREVRTLSHREEAQLAGHAETCTTCREASAASDDDDGWWIMRASGEPSDEPVIPTVNPNVFVLGEEVAAGGMGRVLRARDRRLGRDVAIKESLDPGMHVRFEREALITARLQHPAIVPIYEAGMWPDGTRFYTMRLVPGQTLGGALADAETLPQRLTLLRHVIAATEAVAHAHGRQIIHRDLKPGNILIGDLGETVVIDWGIARRLDHDDGDVSESMPALGHQLTRIGSVLGTPGYMAPEQARGEPLDERADVFALGTILYSLLAGHAPYGLDDKDVDQLVARIGREPAPSIDFAAAEAPKDLRTIVTKAMAFDRAERYPTAREMADDLRRFETGQLLARPYTASELLGRWVRRHKTSVTIAMLALVALATVSIVLVRGLASARDLAEVKQAEAEAARTVADRERSSSELALTRSLEDQGRQALLADAPDRALVLLAEARRRGRDTPALRHLLVAAMRNRDLIRKTIEMGVEPAPLAVAITDRELISIGADKVRSWSDDKLKVRLVRDARDGVMLANGVDVVMVSDREVSRHRLTTQTKRWSFSAELAPKARIASAPDRLAIATPASLVVLDLATGTQLAAIPFAHATSYAFSADGKQLAAANASELKVWNARFQQVSRWELRDELAHLVVIDDRRVIGAGSSSVTLWAGDVVRRLGHDFQTPLLQLAPGPRLVAAGDRKGRLVAWTFEGDEVGSGYSHAGITALAFSPDGHQLAVCDSERTVVYDSHALAPIAEIATPEATTIAWRGDGAQLAVGGEYRLWRLDRPTGIVRHRIDAAYSFVAGSSWVATGPAGSVVRSLATGEELGRFEGFAPGPDRRGTVSRDGSRLVIPGSGEIRIVTLPAGTTTATIREVALYQLAAEGTRVAVTREDETGGGMLRALDSAGRVIAERPYAKNQLRGIEAGPDRTLILRIDLAIELVDFDTLVPRTRIELGRIPMAATTSPRGDRLLTRIGDDNKSVLATFEVATGRSIGELPVRAQIGQLWIANDGTVGIHVNKGTVEVYPPTMVTPSLVVPHVTERAAALSPSGDRLIVGRKHGELEIWDVASGSLLERVRAHRAAIVGVEWIDDDRFVLQSQDDTATLWDVPRTPHRASEIEELAKTMPWRVEAGGLVRK